MYASGKHAIAQCDRCGWKQKWTRLALEPGTGWRVCQECNDKNFSFVAHPQNFPATNLTDAVALRWARPETHAYSQETYFLLGSWLGAFLFSNGLISVGSENTSDNNNGPYYLSDENGNVLEWYQETIIQTATSAGQMNYQSAPFGYGD